MRLDKWLWAARFYKTRQLAVDAITGGHVHLHGQRTKPGREIRVGSRLRITKAGLQWNIEVLCLPRQRRPAAEARTFYAEDEESRARRESQIEHQRIERPAALRQPSARPSKRNRRLIQRFKQQQPR